MTQLWRALQSRDLAFLLLAVIAGGVILTLFIPQRSHGHVMENHASWKERWGVVGSFLEAVGLTDVYSSWWFLAVVALALLSTLACTVTRFGQELRRTGRDWGRLGPEEIRRLPQWGEVPLRQVPPFLEPALRAPVTPGLRGVRRWLEGRGWLVQWEVVEGGQGPEVLVGGVVPDPAPVDSRPRGRGRLVEEKSVIASEAKQSQGGLGEPTCHSERSEESRPFAGAQGDTIDTPAPGRRGRPRPRPGVGLGDEADYGPGGEVGYLFAEKGWLSSLGSIVFHLSLLVIALGVVYSQVVRQEGSMVIAEGITVTEQRPDYLMMSKAPLLGEDYRAFQVKLERFVPTYYQGWTVVDAVADLTVLEEGRPVRRQLVRVNEPLEYKGVSFVLERYGYSPQFVVRDAAGQVIFDYYVNLRVLDPSYLDSFEVAETGWVVQTRFFPDMALEEGRLTTRSLEPKNPVFELHLSRGGLVLFFGPVALNQSVSVGQYTLTFADLDYWTQYRVVKDPGMGLVFAGFWVGLGALIVRYLYNRKRLWGFVEERPEGTRLVLGGRAEQFGAIFGEEFEVLMAELKKELGDGPR